MSDDLVARLRHAWDERERQYDEDERVIGAACLHIDDCGDSGFASRFDEDRLLAEVQRGRRDLAAKRRILDHLSDAQSRRLYYDRDGEEPFVSEARATVEALQNVVRVLAEAEGLA